MARLKFGFHIGSTGIGVDRSFYEELDGAGIPYFAKGSDSLPFDAQQVAQGSNVPHVVVYRRSTAVNGDVPPSGNPDVPDYNKIPQAAAAEHWAWHKAHLPVELDKNITWIETINEVDKNRAEWLAEFALATAQLTMAEGYKWLAFGWSTGEPEASHWQGIKMRQFLNLVAENPDKLGIALHEYSLDVNTIDVPSLIGRYRNVLAVNPGVNIYITEWGWTYNDAPPTNTAMAHILEAGTSIYNIPQVKGCAIWALNGGWGGINQTVRQYIAPLKELTLNTVLPDIVGINNSFEQGWIDVPPAPDRLQQPNGWQLNVLTPGAPIWAINQVTGEPSIVTNIPECIHKHNSQLPPDEQIGGVNALILDGEYVYKIQAVNMVVGVQLTTTLTGLIPNTQYAVFVPVQVHYQNVLNEPDDIEVWVNNNHYWADVLPDREWTQLETIVTSNTLGHGSLDLRFMTKWANSRDFFVDNLRWVAVETPPPPPGLNYRSIPVLLPQDATLDEIVQVRTAEFANRRTITQSHDEVIRLVELGKPGSYAIIYDIERWPLDNQAQLLAIPHELRQLAPPGFTLVYRPCETTVVTQPFGANPDNYPCCPGHDGIDYAVSKDKPFFAAATGMVLHASDHKWSNNTPSAYGWHVVLDHGTHCTVYGHARADLPVQVGQLVNAGQIVGYSGNTGNSTGYHLHFGVLSKVDTGNDYPMWVYGQAVDPAPFLVGTLNPPIPTATVDILSFMRADPTAWVVVRHPDGQQEDFRMYDYGNDAWAMVKGGNAEWWHADNTYIYLTKDTSPEPAADGTERFYVVTPGRWCKRSQAVGETFNDGGHYVQFYSKATCQPHPQNSGNATNNTTIAKLERNYTFNRYGQNLTLDEVLFIQGGVETQIFARHHGKALGRVGWVSPWGSSEIVELYFDRGVLNVPPTEYC